MSSIASASELGGLELVWTNPSPTGPTRTSRTDPQDFIVFRLDPGTVRTVCRSGLEQAAAPINNLDTDISFPGAKVVSREHASLEWRDGSLILQDRGSIHGTYVARFNSTFTGNVDLSHIDDALYLPKTRVNGVLPLHFGDLIEFGRACSRSETTYFPVRCYVRPALGNFEPIGSTAFKPGSFSFAHTIDLTSEDEVSDGDDVQELDTVANSTFETPSLEDVEDYISESDSDESTDPFDVPSVHWVHEVIEAASELDSLEREKLEAKTLGEDYMSSYKATQECHSPATSVEAASPIPTISDNTSDVEKLERAEAEESQIRSSLKRKLDEDEAADSNAGRGTTFSAASSPLESAVVPSPELSEQTPDSSPPATATESSSSLPSPVKKRRSQLYLRKRGNAAVRPSICRARQVKTIMAKAICTTRYCRGLQTHTHIGSSENGTHDEDVNRVMTGTAVLSFRLYKLARLELIPMARIETS
ncbi:hypothetical protein PHSY_000901 [Pseudozyma hubeiensis SY62]|uniref:FHA domain-containing protein n=1 Tax=Pseudozyma hubeiensis (strain SY62) TaxID=1305764 RepID=R9NXN2_PSEHS|nr:hypothetical protein PHSY_000901 [Pseudozyma hubeiensis SY62]GAC93336.1 hypothetical protein PHSY_000901 [Pseudozyma hubeiensis SY62]